MYWIWIVRVVELKGRGGSLERVVSKWAFERMLRYVDWFMQGKENKEDAVLVRFSL